MVAPWASAVAGEKRVNMTGPFNARATAGAATFEVYEVKTGKLIVTGVKTIDIAYAISAALNFNATNKEQRIP